MTPIFIQGIVAPTNSSFSCTGITITDQRKTSKFQVGKSAFSRFILEPGTRESLGNVREKLRTVTELGRKNGSERSDKQECSKSLASSPPYPSPRPPLKGLHVLFLSSFFYHTFSNLSKPSFLLSFTSELFSQVRILGVLLFIVLSNSVVFF